MSPAQPRTEVAAHVALIGDRDDSVQAHRAIPIALGLATEHASTHLDWTWVGTDTLDGDVPEKLGGFDAAWCVPASPYASTSGALAAIRWARESGRPFLGTCGGFQHALLEYAGSCWGVRDAAHAELDPSAPDPVIAPLTCSLVEVTGRVLLREGSRLAALYGTSEATEGYHCRFGLSPRYAARLESGPLRASAWDEGGEVRAIELEGHPFFVATLFQPERSALVDRSHPIIEGFAIAAARAAANRG